MLKFFKVFKVFNAVKTIRSIRRSLSVSLGVVGFFAIMRTIRSK